MRGERAVVGQRAAMVSGSSPHARGTLIALPAQRQLGRFIPACAGNAYIPHWNLPYDSVHPRMRGERQADLSTSMPLAGSSPHARGTLERLKDAVNDLRFIPACAGNATEAAVSKVQDPVHPRMRGERRGLVHRDRSLFGSSPHARGTHFNHDALFLPVRFIPACAGNARKLCGKKLTPPVHPRMRGERGHSNTSSRWRCGSSPHARGTLLGVFRPLAGTRFIPACAGNAYRFPAEWWAEAVHPRMRGERQVAHRRPGERDGSSPHARGTQDRDIAPVLIFRFIPACAGNAGLR